MKKVLFGIVTTAAVFMLTYVIVKSSFIAYPTWFSDLTRYIFIGQIDYYASMGIDLGEFRLWSAAIYLIGTTVLSAWIVGEITNVLELIGKAISAVVKAA